MRPCLCCKNPGCAGRGDTELNYEGDAITCLGFEPMTNVDRIRVKSDEELAEWIETIVSCLLCPLKNKSCKGGRFESRASCKQHWLDWLREEGVADGI